MVDRFEESGRREVKISGPALKVKYRGGYGLKRSLNIELTEREQFTDGILDNVALPLLRRPSVIQQSD
jgi:hypothetical protein